MSDINTAISAATSEVVVSQMTGKKFYLSKTFWVNVLCAAGLVLQMKFGFVIGAELQALALTAINLGLRKITNQPVTW
jgi:hypothetical protein